MPVTIANWFTLTSRPRMRGGEISAIYNGESVEASPMARPPTRRAITNCVRSRGSAAAIDEAVNNAAAASSTRFLPKRSLVNAAKLAPRTHPSSRLLAPISVCESFSANWRLRKTMAPLMTAVSKPNSNPPIAAMEAEK